MLMTLREAQSLTAPALAARVLGLSGGSMHEAKVDPGSPPFGSPRQLAAIEFAGTPDGSAIPDLCMVVHVEVGFVPTGLADDAPGRAQLPRVEQWWSFLPPPSGRATLDEQRAACAAMAPVLRATSGIPRFFPVSVGVNGEMDHDQAALLATALKALAEPATLAGVPVVCPQGGADPCTLDARLAGIDPRRPSSVNMGPCRTDSSHFCLEARYDAHSVSQTGGNYLAVTIELTDADGAAGRFRPLRITLARIAWVV